MANGVLQTSLPLTGNDVQLKVVWKNGINLKSISNTIDQLKIHLKKASLYSFWNE
jgi:hypothetical protein